MQGIQIVALIFTPPTEDSEGSLDVHIPYGEWGNGQLIKSLGRRFPALQPGNDDIVNYIKTIEAEKLPII